MKGVVSSAMFGKGESNEFFEKIDITTKSVVQERAAGGVLSEAFFLWFEILQSQFPFLFLCPPGYPGGVVFSPVPS